MDSVTSLDEIQLQIQINSILVNIKKELDLLKKKKLYFNVLYLANLGRLRFNNQFFYKIIIDCLIEIGDILTVEAKNNLKQFDEYLVKADIFYNAALVISEKHNYKNYKEDIIKKIKLVEVSFLQIIGIDCSEKYKNAWLNSYNSNKQKLNVIKNYVEDNLPIEYEKINASECDKFLTFSDKIENLTHETNRRIKGFFVEIIENCLTIVKNKHEFCIASLGSLAKDMATPFSDIEFIIFVDEKNETVTKDIKNFCYLLNLKIINLGHSLIPSSILKTENSLSIEIDDILEPGFQFDLGGKTPLGREDQDYDLIQTPETMLQYLLPEAYLKDYLLTSELYNCQYLFGKESLLNEYNNMIPVADILCGGIFSRAKKNIFDINIANDFYRLDPRLNNPDKIGQQYKIKRDLYRLPTEFILYIAYKYSINSCNPIKIIHIATKKAYITKTAASDLIIMLNILAYLRLKSYLHFKKQQDATSFNVKYNRYDESINLCKLFNKELIFRLYYTLVPFLQKIKVKEDRFFTSLKFQERFYDNSYAVQGELYLRILDFERAIACLEKAKEHGLDLIKDNHDKIKLLENLARSYSYLRNYSAALENHLLIRNISELYIQELTDNQAKTQLIHLEKGNYGSCLGNIAGIYYYLKKNTEAIDHYEKALAIHLEVYGEFGLDIGKGNIMGLDLIITDRLNLIKLYNEQQNYSAAFKHQDKVQFLIKKINPQEAIYYNFHFMSNKFSQLSIDELHSTLNQLEANYGADHLYLTDLNWELGIKYQERKDYNLALRHYNEYFKINYNIFGMSYDKEIIIKLYEFEKFFEEVKNEVDKSYLNISVMIHLSEIFSKKADIMKAIMYAHLATLVCHQLKGSNLIKGATWLNLASLYHAHGKYDQASSYYKKLESFYSDQKDLELNHMKIEAKVACLDIEISKADVVDSNSGKYYDSKINKLLDKVSFLLGKEHSLAARLYNIRGCLLQGCNQISIALKNFDIAYNINNNLYKINKNPTSIIINLTRLGQLFLDIQNFKEAGEYYYLALMKAEKWWVEHDPHIAKIKIILGIICFNLKIPKLALNFYQKALPIFEKNYPAPAEETVNLYWFIGKCYKESGDLNEAYDWYQKYFNLINVNAVMPCALKEFSNLAERLNKFNEAKIFQTRYEAIQKNHIKMNNPNLSYLGSKATFFFNEVENMTLENRNFNKGLSIQMSGYKALYEEEEFSRYLDDYAANNSCVLFNSSSSI